jgi:hypothetical protein
VDIRSEIEGRAAISIKSELDFVLVVMLERDFLVFIIVNCMRHEAKLNNCFAPVFFLSNWIKSKAAAKCEKLSSANFSGLLS